MASSSSMIPCFNCNELSSSFEHFRKGWRLHNGEFAQLCHNCASAYEEGYFCEAFHITQDGWKVCDACGKFIHRGCNVSHNPYVILDFGGVICMECSRINDMERIRRSTTRPSIIEVQNRPRCTYAELQEILRPSDSVVIPLFEIKLSASNADSNLSCLILPIQCVEGFFPDISEPRGLPITIRDTEGIDWEVKYRYRIISGYKVYMLERIRELMIARRWQAGDTVTFYRVEPGGRMAIGLRKGSGNQSPPNENST